MLKINNEIFCKNFLKLTNTTTNQLLRYDTFWGFRWMALARRYEIFLSYFFHSHHTANMTLSPSLFANEHQLGCLEQVISRCPLCANWAKNSVWCRVYCNVFLLFLFVYNLLILGPISLQRLLIPFPPKNLLQIIHNDNIIQINI